MTDPIADMLTRVRNANNAFQTSTSMPSSTKLVAIAKIMKSEGNIEDYELVAGEPQATLTITLKYGPKKQRTITGLRRISKPGLRVYAKHTGLPKVASANSAVSRSWTSQPTIFRLKMSTIR